MSYGLLELPREEKTGVAFFFSADNTGFLEIEMSHGSQDQWFSLGKRNQNNLDWSFSFEPTPFILLFWHLLMAAVNFGVLYFIFLFYLLSHVALGRAIQRLCIFVFLMLNIVWIFSSRLIAMDLFICWTRFRHFHFSFWSVKGNFFKAL